MLIKTQSECDHYENYIKTVILKEWLVYSDSELFHKFKGYDSQLKLIKQKSITQIINEFINNDLYSQRSLILMFHVWK